MSTILRWEHVVWNVADSTGFHQSQWWYTPACWDGRPEVIWAACTSRRRPRIGRTRQSKRPTCHPRTGQSTLRSRRSGFPPIEDWNAACSVWLFQKPCTVIRVHVVDEIDELFSPSPFSHRVGFFFRVFGIQYSVHYSKECGRMERDEPSRDSSGGHSKQLFYSCKLTFDTVLSSSTTRQQHQQSTFIYHAHV